MNLNDKNRTASGFTLIELMMVVVIVAVLMAIAIPSYTGYAKKARRAEAKAALTGLSIVLERFYSERSPSTYVGAALGTDPNDIFADYAPIDGPAANKTYTLSITSQSASGYTIKAIPTGGQATDVCGTLTLTSLGVKGVEGASSGQTWSDCWE